MDFKIRKNGEHGVAVYRQIADQLRQMIVSGTLQSGDRLPPEPEFAKQLQVNRMTLRKSLQILREELLLVKTPSKGIFILPANERKYRLGIILQKTGSVSFDLYTTMIIRAISSAVRNYENCGTALLSIEENETPDQFFRKTVRAGVDGCIAILFHPGDGKIFTDSIFSGIPIVILGGRVPGFPSVDLDDSQLEPAVRRLTELGHRKIAYVSCRSATTHSISRDRNFAALRKQYHLDSNPDYCVNCDLKTTWFEQGMAAAERLLSLPNPPTAILCNSRAVASGVWNRLLMNGCRIPEDISVIGFDNRYLENPLLSSLEQPLLQMAQKGVDLIFERIEQGRWDPDAHYRFPVELYEGKSIGVCHG